MSRVKATVEWPNLAETMRGLAPELIARVALRAAQAADEGSPRHVRVNPSTLRRALP